MVAAARIAARFAERLHSNASYWCDEDKHRTFVPVINAARREYRRAAEVLRTTVEIPHTCGGHPPRCERCGTPEIAPGFPCTNLLCSAEIDATDWHLAVGPLRPLDRIEETDVAIAWFEGQISHDGGTLFWPCVAFVTLDGDIYEASGFRPTELSSEEVMALPSRNTAYVQPRDLDLGATESRDLASFDGETYRTVGISWYTAYERPATGERFKVYGYDHE